MNELFWFLLGGVYAWVIWDGIGKKNRHVTVTVDWASIKQGIESDGMIVVRPIIDWPLIARVLEVEGYTVIRRELH